MNSPYRGRFAPSPTGSLHAGSLACALASWLDARAAGGAWLVRIEDIDPPREKPGAADDILRTLEAHGLWWDGDVLHQSTRTARYEEFLARLVDIGLAFRCPLSRAQLEACGTNHPGRAVSEAQVAGKDFAWRLDVPDEDICFVDRIQGRTCYNVARTGGPFVIRRRDGLFAYQLAVVVDDADQGITDIVRGADLLDSTPRQLLLLRALGLPVPRYAHIPVLTDAQGEKLSKQEAAAPVGVRDVTGNLRRALLALGQHVPEAGTPAELLAAAIAGWRIEDVPARPAVRAPDR